MLAHFQAAVDGACAMLVQARGLGAEGGRVVGVLGPFGDGATVQEGHLLGQQGGVARGVDVVDGGIGQPEQVVREMRAHAGTGWRVPPVLHIAFWKLPRGPQQNLLAQHVRRRAGQGQRILQLVPETKGPASLVEARLGPQAARHGLVQQPAVDHGIEQGVGGFDRGGAQTLVPVLAHLLQAKLGRHEGAADGQVPSRVQIVGMPQQKDLLHFRAGLDGQTNRQGRAGVQAHAAPLAKVVGQHQTTARVKTFTTVASPVFRRAGVVKFTDHGQESRATAKAGRLLTLRGHQRGDAPRATDAAWVWQGLGERAGAHRMAVGAVGTHHPFDQVDGAQLQGLAAMVDQFKLHLLDGGFRVHAPTDLHAQIAPLVLDDADTLAVANPVGHSRATQGRWCDVPHLAGFLVLQQQPLARGIAHGVVGPRGDLVQAAVHRPGIAATSF